MDLLNTDTLIMMLKGIHVWEVDIWNNYDDDHQPTYSPQRYPVLATSSEQAEQIILSNPDLVLTELLSKKLRSGDSYLSKSTALKISKDHIGLIYNGTRYTRRCSCKFIRLLSPDGVISVKLYNGTITDVKQDKKVDSA